MNRVGPGPQGLGIAWSAPADLQALQAEFDRLLAAWGLSDGVQTACVTSAQGPLFTARLRSTSFGQLCPAFDTLAVRTQLQRLSPATEGAAALEREVCVALLAAPTRIDFGSLQEFQAHVRVRCNIARAAEKTALAFKTTDAAERPEAFWR